MKVHEDFEKFKEMHYKKWLEAREKNLVDREVVGIVENINKCKDFYTTSSCFGRIAISISPLGAKKYEYKFIEKWHHFIKYEDLKKGVNKALREVKAFKKKFPNREIIIWIKFYPFILHVGCRNIEVASKLVKISIESGLKESGIFEIGRRILVRIEGVDRLEVGIGNDEKLWISEEFLKEEFKILKERQMRNLQKIKRFSKKFFDTFLK